MILLRYWMSICPYWFYIMYQPRSSMCPTRIILGLMINADMILASGRRLIFSGPMIAPGLTGEFVCCQVIADKTYSEAKCQFSVKNKDVLINTQYPNKWWSTLKFAVFSLSLSLPPLVGGLGLSRSVGKADQLSDYFDSKQSRESVDLLPTAIHLQVLSPLPSGWVRSGVSC